MWRPNVLVFSSSGTGGYYQLGMLMSPEIQSILDKIDIIVGTASGSVIALLYNIGYSPEDITNELIDFCIFKSVPFLEPKDLLEDNNGLTNNIIREKLVKLIKAKFGIIPNLENLYKLTNQTLTLITSNLDTGKIEILNKNTEPALSCIDAVMLSISMTRMFHKMKYKGDSYSNGSLGNPYPVDIYDDGKNNILGLSVNETILTDSISSYMYNLFMFPIKNIRKILIEKSSVNCKHLIIERTDDDILTNDIDKEIKLEMILKGFKCSKLFVENLMKNKKEDLHITIKPTDDISEIEIILNDNSESEESDNS